MQNGHCIILAALEHHSKGAAFSSSEKSSWSPGAPRWRSCGPWRTNPDSCSLDGSLTNATYVKADYKVGEECLWGRRRVVAATAVGKVSIARRRRYGKPHRAAAAIWLIGQPGVHRAAEAAIRMADGPSRAPARSHPVEWGVVAERSHC
jgi:hypothetical protein